jgi:hypothetical protein
MLGTWRGLAIQTNFSSGEYDLKIDKPTASGAEVLFRYEAGATSTGQINLDQAGVLIYTMSFTAGPMAGKTLHGGFDLWEAGPETVQAAFYFGAAGEAAPASAQTAMKAAGSTVLSMSKCSEVGGKCDFDNVFDEVEILAEMAVTDPCNPNKNCSACIGDPSGLCGWCSTEVTYSGVSTGSQCAGFDSSGKPLGWQCSGVFSKSECSDYGCDWSDISGPKCVKGLGKQTSGQCSDLCKPPQAKFSCNVSSKMCEPCNMHYCTTNAQCPGSYCNKAGVGPWSCHGAVPAGCTDKASCSTSCGAEEEYAICDHYAGTCTPTANKSAPGAQTKYDCSHTCTPNILEGIYRAVAINSGFERGEWDFSFYSNASVHWSSPAGHVTVASLAGSSQAVEHGAFAVEATVLRSDDPGMKNKKLYALFRPDGQGNDGLVKDLFLGMASAPVGSFDAAMAKTEFVMVGCQNGVGCDFSKVQV